MNKGQKGTFVQISLVHMQISESMEKNLDTAEQMLYKAADSGSKFICLPEYFAFPASLEDNNQIEMISDAIHDQAVQLLKHV